MYIVKQSLTESFICYQLAVENYSHCTFDAYKYLFASCKESHIKRIVQSSFSAQHNTRKTLNRK